jgi:hypothetical protein
MDLQDQVTVVKPSQELELVSGGGVLLLQHRQPPAKRTRPHDRPYALASGSERADPSN